MLCLQHDFRNIILKIRQIVYSLRVRPPPPKKNSGCAPVYVYFCLAFPYNITTVASTCVTFSKRFLMSSVRSSLPNNPPVPVLSSNTKLLWTGKHAARPRTANQLVAHCDLRLSVRLQLSGSRHVYVILIKYRVVTRQPEAQEF
jgi:hypothetical protein